MKRIYQKLHSSAWICTVALGALFAGASAAGPSHAGTAEAAETAGYIDGAGYPGLQREQTDCRRYSITWSGGVARRGPDRISPRPVRSRWQDPGTSRVRCQDGDGFRQRRVAARPWIR